MALAATWNALRLTPDESMIPLFGQDQPEGKRNVLEGRLIWLALSAGGTHDLGAMTWVTKWVTTRHDCRRRLWTFVDPWHGAASSTEQRPSTASESSRT